jgi:hypothetical protein
MKLQAITYKIPMYNFWTKKFEKNIQVKGYAIDFVEFPGLHFCVRHDGYSWVGDHYETGLGVGVSEDTKFSAVKAIANKVRETRSSGKLYAAFKSKGFAPEIT